uniref:Myb/SANT-like DNA-binding domain-containing protein 1 n=1 Tax=Bactrocera dorsalis TaxID=27457 RepID=A0A034VT48_BACDO
MASGDIVMKKKRVVWNEAAETDLIQLWKEKMPKLQSTRKNSHIYEEMSREMNTFGHNYTATEIKIKMHNFTNKYKQEKRKVGAFGGSSSVWKHFAAVHQAIGGYKSFCSDELVEDSIMVDTDEIGSFPVEVKNEAESSLSSLGEPPSPTESPDPFASSNPFAPRSPAASSSDPSNLPSSRDARKIKKKTAVSVMEEMRKDFLKATQAMKETDEKRLLILEKYAKDISEMKDAFIDFLRRQN